MAILIGGKQSLWSKLDGFHGLQRLYKAKCSISRNRLSHISIRDAYVSYKAVLWGLLDLVQNGCLTLLDCYNYMPIHLKMSNTGNLLGLQRCHAFWVVEEKAPFEVKYHGDKNHKNLWRGNGISNII